MVQQEEEGEEEDITLVQPDGEKEEETSRHRLVDVHLPRAEQISVILPPELDLISRGGGEREREM